MWPVSCTDDAPLADTGRAGAFGGRDAAVDAWVQESGSGVVDGHGGDTASDSGPHMTDDGGASDGSDGAPSAPARADATTDAFVVAGSGCRAAPSTGDAGPSFDTTVDGVAVDRSTCLVWQRMDPPKEQGDCPPPPLMRNHPAKLCWVQADAYCQSLRLNGQTDWRLPTRAELKTLLVPDWSSCPRIDKTVFPEALPTVYWTSEVTDPGTMYAPGHAYGVDFCSGSDVNAGRGGPLPVRCVRGPAH
jgi:hypothetical protein